MEVGCRDQGKVRAAEVRNRQLLVIHASENRETKFSWKWYQSRPECGLINDEQSCNHSGRAAE